MVSSAGGVRIWYKQDEHVAPSCLISTVLSAGDVMMWRIFSWHPLGPLVPTDHHLNAHSLTEDRCWPSLSLHDHSAPASDGYFQQDNAPFHKAQIISILNMTLSSMCANCLHSHRSQSNSAPPKYGGTEHCIMDVQLTGMFQHLVKSIPYHETLRQFWMQMGVQ